ncbi:hypothetical protein [Corynebacterium sp.]|uniref:hypothetical protein n=1 Tax=Corynebacterium sp. TaxID=1720 RepID=UPI0026DA94A6|nr:hypothetical protein [Corynebacterium sp.]MDO5031237.1 hypothetical protein [Corynebacterium sp.]
MNTLRTNTTPIPTPLWVRAGSSALSGAAIAVGASRLHFGLALGLSLVLILLACSLTLLHPYRQELRDYAQDHNVTMLPTIAQLLPLMVLWLLFMLAPLFSLPVWGCVVVFLLVTAATYVLFPHVDGSRKLAFA